MQTVTIIVSTHIAPEEQGWEKFKQQTASQCKEKFGVLLHKFLCEKVDEAIHFAFEAEGEWEDLVECAAALGKLLQTDLVALAEIKLDKEGFYVEGKMAHRVSVHPDKRNFLWS